MKSNIDDPRWHAKIAYQRGICALWQGDRTQAAREIEALQPITAAVTDVDLLQLHLDLNGRSMGMTERLAFFDQIRSLSKNEIDKLQYGGARAFEILLAGDETGARMAFGEVIKAGREFEKKTKLSAAAELWFCRALEGKAVIDQDAASFAEIDERLSRLLGNDSWTKAGRANVWRNIADARRYPLQPT